MTNVLTVLCSDFMKRMQTRRDIAKPNGEDKENCAELERLMNALKLESPLYALINRDTGFPQIAFVEDHGGKGARIAVLLFTEEHIAKHEAESMGDADVFCTEIPKFLMNDGEPLDVRSAFFRRCYLLGAEYVLMNPVDGNAPLRVPVNMLAVVKPDIDSETERMQMDVNRITNGTLTLLKQEACAGNQVFCDMFRHEVMQRVQATLFLTPVKDSHPLVFKEQADGKDVSAIYLFTNTDEARGVMKLDCELARVELDDIMPLATEHGMWCIVNPFSRKFVLNKYAEKQNSGETADR